MPDNLDNATPPVAQKSIIFFASFSRQKNALEIFRNSLLHKHLQKCKAGGTNPAGGDIFQIF
jgi:hypothetical protein